MAGVGAGIGVPLLLALLATLFIIYRQRKRLQTYPSEKSESSQALHPQSQAHGPQQQGSYGAPSPAWSQPPQQYQPTVAAKYEDPNSMQPFYRPGAAPAQQSHFREGVEPGIPLGEMSGEGRRQELAASLK